jgi:hypothetical protein
MTTGKHTDLQTLQNSDGTFELVVSSEASEEWSDVEDLRAADVSTKSRVIPWKPIVAGVLAVAVVGFVGSKVIRSISSGVSVDEEPLPIVTGFRPYLGGAAASLGTARSARPAAGQRNVPDEEDWVDPETEERELVVEQGEAVPTDQIEEIPDEPQIEEEIVEPVDNEIHEIEPSVPRLPTDTQGLQKNLNNQLRALSSDRVDMPFARPNLRGFVPEIDGATNEEPAMEEPEDGDIQPSEENEEESEE